MKIRNREFDVANPDYIQLFKSGAILGVKQTNYNLFQMERILNLNPDLIAFDGYDETMVAGQALGSSGSIGSTFNMMLPHYKKIFDLYIADSTTDPTQLSAKTGDDANSEFALGEAAFYQNGTWAWTDLQKAGMKAESVGMMPIYTGVKGEEKQGVATGSENYWCINDKASDADKKATEDFLSWVITSDTGKKAISQDMGFTTPFKTFDDVKFDNPLTEAAVEDQKSGKTQVSWNFTMMPSEEWKNKLGSALLEYAQGTGDWDAVVSAFVDGWATEYAAANGQ